MEILFNNDSDKPLVSLILLDWSCRESFHTLKYLSQQTVCREEYEIIWIEYYSRRCPEISAGLKKYKNLGKPPIVDKWIVMDMPDNIYYHKHLMYNIGIVASKGKIITICDSDAVFKTTFVESIIKTFEKNPNTVLHMDEIRNIDKKFYPFNYPSIEEIAGDGCINWANGKTTGVLDKYDPLHTRNYGSCMSSLKEDLINIGGADEHIDYLGHVCGPYDMTFRLVNAGKKETWHQEEFLYHTWHPGTDGRNNYLGPHDGKNMSSTALEAMWTKRVLPLVENPAIKILRLKKEDKTTKELLLSRVISKDKINHWMISETKHLISLGRIAYHNKAYDEALKHWKMALQGSPQDCSLLSEMGWIYYFKTNYKKASNLFSKAIELDESNQSAFRGRAWTCFQTQEFDKAIEDFSKVLDGINPHDRTAIENTYRGLGWAYFCKNCLDDALQNFLKAIANANLSDKGVLQDLYRGAGWTYAKKGDFTEAEAYFIKAIENISPENQDILKDALNGLEATCKALGKEPLDNVIYRRMIESSKDAPLKKEQVYKVEPASSYKHQDQAGTLKSGFLCSMGWAYYLKSNYKDALSAFNEAIRQDSDNHSAYRGRAWTFLQKCNFDAAIQDFNQAIAYKDKFGRNELQEVHRGRGWANYHKGNFAEAISDFNEALKNVMDSEYHVLKHIYQGRSWAYYRLGMLSKALEDFKKTKGFLSSSKFLAKAYLALWVFDSRIKHKLKNMWDENVASFYGKTSLEYYDWRGYPCAIPTLDVQPNLDFLLLELPPRYRPIMPNGLGYVHNILANCGINFQTIDANIILYHRYHERRLREKLDPVISPSGYKMAEDPWDSANMGEWDKDDVIDYFWPDLEELLEGIIRQKPKVVGISLSGNNRTLAKKFVKELRMRAPDILIVVGGYDCGYHDLGRYLFPDFDYMVIGEAEGKLEPLVEALSKNKKPKDLPGILSRYDSPERIWSDIPRLQDLDSIDFPHYQWVKIEQYDSYDRKHLIPITASRGCNWGRCRFCGECLPFRRRNPIKVADEIEYFAKKGYHSFHFNESDVNGDPEALYDLCTEIIKRKLKVDFVAQLRIDKRNSLEYFRHLAKAGFAHLRFGVDGWTDKLTRLQGKGYNMELVFQNLRDCHAAGITTTVNIVIGVPGETEDDVDETIQNITRCNNYIDEVISFNTLILTYGSEYYWNPEKYKIRFWGDKKEIYSKHVHYIPTELWYSEDPYIDQEVRMQRLDRIATGLYKNGVNIGSFASRVVENLRKERGSKALKTRIALINNKPDRNEQMACDGR